MGVICLHPTDMALPVTAPLRAWRVANLGNVSYNRGMGNSESAASLLRELRRRQGDTLRSAASEIGVAPSQLSRMERGERAIGESTAKRLADFYNVPAEIIELSNGHVPADIVRILQSHPAEIDRLREVYRE